MIYIKSLSRFHVFQEVYFFSLFFINRSVIEVHSHSLNAKTTASHQDRTIAWKRYGAS